MIKGSGHSQTVKLVKRENICTHSKGTRLLVTICKDKNIQKKVLTNASFWRDVFMVDQSDSEKSGAAHPKLR